MHLQQHNSQILKEYRTVNLANRERILPYHLPVTRVGTLPRKKQWVNECDMKECSFNIILSGSGYLRNGKDLVKLESPCLFSPSAYPNSTYGPNDAWEELFIIYPENVRSRLQASGYLEHTDMLHTNIYIGNLLPMLNELKICINDINRPGVTDRIDFLCEAIIRGAILSKHTTKPGPEYRALLAVRDDMRSNYTVDPNVNEIARKCGMSQSSFRRCWAKYFVVPPKRYIMDYRIEQACHHLMNSERSIKDIAYMVGFNDPLYFSKSFHRHIGMTPSKFRA